MRIEDDIKLDYSDVLIRPKRSTLGSRKDVRMKRKFTFRNSQKVMDFLPIFASNMDGVGTFSMARQMQKHKMMTVITKSMVRLLLWSLLLLLYLQVQTTLPLQQRH